MIIEKTLAAIAFASTIKTAYGQIIETEWRYFILCPRCGYIVTSEEASEDACCVEPTNNLSDVLEGDFLSLYPLYVTT